MAGIKFCLFLIGLIFLCGTVAAAPSYSSTSGVSFSATDNIHSIPQLYTALVGVYGQTYTDQNVMKQISSGVWWISTGLNIPDSATTFYINDSTCSELRLGVSSSGSSLSGYPIISNTKLICWVSGAPSSFSQSGAILIYKPVHDVVINNFQSVSLSELSYCSVYNVSMNSTKKFLTFPNADHITVNQVTVTNGDPVSGGGLEGFYANYCTFSNISTYNTGNHLSPASGSYGMSFSGSNNIVKDSVFDGSAWSTFNIFASDSGDHPSKNTVVNVVVRNSGHNGFEIEGNDSHFINCSVYNSKLHNFFQVGKQDLYKKSVNNTYDRIYSYNPGTSSMKISEGSDNITVTNATFIGNGFEIDDSSNSTVINCNQDGNAPTRPSDQAGYRTTVWSGYFNYCRDHTVIDSNFVNDASIGESIVIDSNQHIINCKGTRYLAPGYTHDVTTYYYPNLVVRYLNGTPVQNVAVTANTSVLNGLGKSQSVFYTDQNGKLYSSGNRANWLAVPDQKEDNSGTTSYITSITATKDGKKTSVIVDPSSSWYSPNPASLQGSEIDLILDANGSTPIPNFKSNISSGYAPLAVQFTDLSTGSPISWKWNFGDGGSSTQQNPTHVYTLAGTYTVNLTVSNAYGTNSKLASITVSNNGQTSTAPVLPVANFNSNVTTGIVPLSVKFTDLSKNATGWYWNFGDGSTSKEQNPTHIYTVAGTYTVNLTVSNANGTNSKLATITVSATASTKTQIPAATFSASPISGVAPLSVTFTDQSTNSPTAWNWNFGDGTANSTVKNPTHTYSKAGSFTVKLTTKNTAGSNAIAKSNYIKVITKPVAAFSAYPLLGKAPLKVQFTDRSTGSPTSWAWNFGDGTAVSTVKNPAHTYNNKGNYTVTLTVKNAAGSNYIKKSGYIKVSKK